MGMRNRLVGGTLFAALLAGGSARADILVDNINQPTRGTTILGTVPPDNLWAAQSFSGPMAVRLTSIDVLVGEAADPPDVVAELRSGDDPSGPLLATFSVPALVPAGLAVATLVPDTNIVLEPDTVYWLVLGTATTGAFGWGYAEGNGSDGPGSLLWYTYSEDSGATWGAQGTDNPHQMRVNVSDVACRADFNGDGSVNTLDVLAFLNAWSAGEPGGDFNGDGTINTLDVLAFLNAWSTGC